MDLKLSNPYVIAGAAGLAFVLWVSMKGPKSAGQALGGGAVDLADGVISGAVIGVGEAVGIPPTNMTECERAKAEGRTWDASFACPAGDFLKYVFN
jgi:hypothetical protein